MTRPYAVTADHAEQVRRMEAFLGAHPGVHVACIGSGGPFQASWTDAEGSDVTVTRYERRDLLDRLDEMFSPQPDGGLAGARTPARAACCREDRQFPSRTTRPAAWPALPEAARR